MRTYILPLVLLVTCTAVHATTIYNSNPSPLPPNVTSLGYEATSTQEFGGLIGFGTGSRNLIRVMITMSAHALQADNPGVGTADGYVHPITINLYEVGPGNTVGAGIVSRTVNALVPWRPPASADCNGGWRAGDGTCYSGVAFPVSFDLTGVTVPDRIIFGVAFNTEHHGYNPIGTPGPYNALNYGVSNQAPASGTYPLPGTVYWNTTNASFLADAGAGGVGVFRQDQNWTYIGAITFESADSDVPEPGTTVLFGGALLSLILYGSKTRGAREKANLCPTSSTTLTWHV